MIVTDIPENPAGESVTIMDAPCEGGFWRCDSHDRDGFLPVFAR
jgi:hypothetical protein